MPPSSFRLPNFQYHLLAAVLAFSTGILPATAQTKLVATITLHKKEIPGAVVQRQDGSVALFLSQPGESAVRVLLLQPDGKVKWEKSIVKMQGLRVPIDPQQPTGPLSQTWIEKLYPTLEPLEVFAQGNTLYAAEVVDRDLERLEKQGDARHHDIVLQRVDSAGALKRFVLPYADISKHISVSSMGSYVEGGVFYQISREVSSRQGTDEYYLNSFDLDSQARQHVPLQLAKLNNSRWAPNFKESWKLLGHCKGITYLCRRYKSSTGSTPEPLVQQQYELLGFDNQGKQVAAMQPGLGLGDYRIVGKSLREAAFYLDPATETLLVSGAYQQTSKNRLLQEPVTAGFFLDRYALTGQQLSHQQVAYADALPAQQKALVQQLAESDGVMVFSDPATQKLVVDVALKGRYAALYFDEKLQFAKSVVTSEKERRKSLMATEYVYHLSPTVKNYSYNSNYITTPVMGEILPIYYFQTSAPLHQQTYALVLKAKDNQPYRRYIGTAAGGTGRMVLEISEPQGGTVKIHTIQ
ncbi:hypothetical protein GCM10011495_36390 [Hymenobacter frigidus]|uniref:Uncharacterized protein n=1 Tax=Hymenobacter frigidus TaxID=1524095 RepID=A0ABQ2AID8_9BACT|nr:hypothetical protein [Hymenobacter frigidus]GGH90464.1 hypothetical protein GCM10011495_36390 [Hymenobacter frigidus]